MEHGLPMVVLDAEYQFDRHKLTFFFEADRRIDFRELVSELFSQYKTRIWMQQVDTSVLPLHDAGTELAKATGFLPVRDDLALTKEGHFDGSVGGFMGYSRAGHLERHLGSGAEDRGFMSRAMGGRGADEDWDHRRSNEYGGYHSGVSTDQRQSLMRMHSGNNLMERSVVGAVDVSHRHIAPSQQYHQQQECMSGLLEESWSFER